MSEVPTGSVKGQPERAKFSERRENRAGDRPMHATRVTACWCGWSTTLRDSSTMTGRTNALTLAKLTHRLDHLEGRVDAALAGSPLVSGEPGQAKGSE